MGHGELNLGNSGPMLDSRVPAANDKRPASCLTCGPSGGLFGIDQEVVTLRGLYGNSGYYYGSPGAT